MDNFIQKHAAAVAVAADADADAASHKLNPDIPILKETRRKKKKKKKDHPI